MQFEDVLQENERIIHHLIHKYRIRDREGDFYQEGLIALWEAVQTYDESRSKLSTHIYNCISSRFLNKIKKENREKEQLKTWLINIKAEDLLIEDRDELDKQLLRDIRKVLSDRQWCWFYHFVLHDQPARDIARHYCVTDHAVKSWARSARSKIQQLLIQQEYV
ncbi:sigma-70 family RNA polymerase sigma factor [Gracilibacillus xinjiangensis]|uniref:Sigma-70 family RNA polymerase sigma factor n=1 Tax=Gracilibacillus xinjiangensis TaxID=1193282 RepID=A0ABV8WTL7_9BACI